jgi:hypothetical protein
MFGFYLRNFSWISMAHVVEEKETTFTYYFSFIDFFLSENLVTHVLDFNYLPFISVIFL